MIHVFKLHFLKFFFVFVTTCYTCTCNISKVQYKSRKVLLYKYSVLSKRESLINVKIKLFEELRESLNTTVFTGLVKNLRSYDFIDFFN